MCMKNKKTKIRVNISVDKELLEKAKTKLSLFGGKISTLFNAYLSDFVETIDSGTIEGQKELKLKIEEIENRLEKLEKK